MPRCGVAITVAAAEAARRQHGERRPCSDVVTANVSDEEPLRAPRSRSVGALASRNLPPPPCPPQPPLQAGLTLAGLLADLQTALQGLQGQHPSVRSLMDQLTAVDQLLKVIHAVSMGNAVFHTVILTAIVKVYLDSLCPKIEVSRLTYDFLFPVTTMTKSTRTGIPSFDSENLM